LTLAGYYAGAGDTQRAIVDYNHTLELSPNRPEVYNQRAINSQLLPDFLPT
jgi:Flp pilus assembly protein TadD